jgi:hypothetical protein
MQYLLFGLFFAAMGPVAIVLLVVGFNHIGEVMAVLGVIAGLMVIAFTYWLVTAEAELAETRRLARQAESDLQSRPAAMLLRPDANADVNGLPISMPEPPRAAVRAPRAKFRATAWASDPAVSKSPFYRG